MYWEDERAFLQATKLDDSAPRPMADEGKEPGGLGPSLMFRPKVRPAGRAEATRYVVSARLRCYKTSYILIIPFIPFFFSLLLICF